MAQKLVQEENCVRQKSLELEINYSLALMESSCYPYSKCLMTHSSLSSFEMRTYNCSYFIMNDWKYENN